MMVTLDPNGAFPTAKKPRLIQACGLIPNFFVDSLTKVAYEQEPETPQNVYKEMVDLYGFGDFSGPTWGTVSPTGTYVSKYPEDPDMEPLLKMESLEGVTLYIYQNAIMALTDGQDTIITRMD